MTTFDAIQVLYDEDILCGETYSAVLRSVHGSADDDEDKRRAAMLLYLLSEGNNVGPDEVEPESYDEKQFTYGRETYRVLTDDEANEAVKEYIRESLWAFRPDFLASETDLPAEAFAALGEKCESGNDGILRMVEKTCGLDAFVKAAISADGRGHFLAGYDSEENECGDYFIYRTN